MTRSTFYPTDERRLSVPKSINARVPQRSAIYLWDLRTSLND